MERHRASSPGIARHGSDPLWGGKSRQRVRSCCDSVTKERRACRTLDLPGETLTSRASASADLVDDPDDDHGDDEAAADPEGQARGAHRFAAGGPQVRFLLPLAA